jgi:hypothetical protein
VLTLWLAATGAAPGQQPATGPLSTVERQIQLQPPSPAQVFRIESEQQWRQRIVRDSQRLRQPNPTLFPKEPKRARQTYAEREWAPLSEPAEPAYVCYGRLYFEQKNFERYGWEMPCCLTPLLSAGIFFFDVAALPYNIGTDPCRCYECSAGYPLPGDCVPFLLYTPECSITGALAEAGTVGVLAAIFP